MQHFSKFFQNENKNTNYPINNSLTTPKTQQQPQQQQRQQLVRSIRISTKPKKTKYYKKRNHFKLVSGRVAIEKNKYYINN